MPSFLSNMINALFGTSSRRPSSSPARPAGRRPRMKGVEIMEERDDGTLMFDLNGAFYVEGRTSPNGRFLVGAVDGYHEGEKVKSGSVVLVDLAAQRVAFRKSLKRAQNPWVSDEGLVAVENWLSWGGPLAGEVVVYRSDGERAWKKRYKANVYRIHLSRSGKRLLVSTANSDHPPHSGKTWLLDAATGDEVWVRDGFGAVRFDGDTPVIGTEGDSNSPTNELFPLDERGQPSEAFHAARAAASDRRNRGQPWWVFRKIDDALKAGSPPDELSALLPLIDEMEAAHELDDKTRARAHRARGEIAERAGELRDAYAWWTRALELDPKVGIKRRHTALGKKLGL